MGKEIRRKRLPADDRIRRLKAGSRLNELVKNRASVYGIACGNHVSLDHMGAWSLMMRFNALFCVSRCYWGSDGWHIDFSLRDDDLSEAVDESFCLAVCKAFLLAERIHR